MARARQRAEWERAGEVLAMLWNTHMDLSRVSAKTAADWDPFPEEDRTPARRGIPITAENITMLKALVPAGKPRRRK